MQRLDGYPLLGAGEQGHAGQGQILALSSEPGGSSYRTAPCAWKLWREWVLNVIPTKKKKKRYLCVVMEMVANLIVESFHDMCMHQITTASLHNLLY